MRYKKRIIFLILISILANLLIFYNSRKYKNIVEENIEYKLSRIFSSADFLEMELGKIISSNTVDIDELNSITNEYEYIIIDLSELRGSVDKINHKNNISNYFSYANIMIDIDKFSSGIIKDNSRYKATLTEADIKFLEKFRKIINKIQDVHKKYSYTKNDTVYLNKGQWKNILKELNEVDMN